MSKTTPRKVALEVLQKEIERRWVVLGKEIKRLGKILVQAVLLFLVVACTSSAQDRTQGGFSDTFTFDKTGAINSWDGSDPNNPPYPGDMGGVSLLTSAGGSYGSSIDAPFQLGYLNNGILSPCDPLTLGPKVWTVGTGANIGDTFTQHGSTTCPYFTGEWGTYNNSNNRLDGFSVDATYTIVQGPRTCPRFHPCYFPHETVLVGGTGTITDTIINQTAHLLYPCGSKRISCLSGN